MILTFDELRAIAVDQEADDWIKLAREDHKKLKLHYYGEGVTEALTQIQGLENKDQIKLRERYAISNQWLTENLLRNCDNAWSAKGGVQKIESQDDETNELIKEKLKNVREGYSHFDYQRDVWFDRFVSDPNGLVFFEVTERNEDGNTRIVTVPTYKSIMAINKMKVTGIQPEYVKFEADEVEDLQSDKGIIKNNHQKKPTLITWIVDDAFYYQVKVADENITILQKIPNSWGKVPGYQNSTILDTNREIKISPIWKQVELMDKYLNNGSIHEIYTFLHGYPVFWKYQQPCKSCKGTKYSDEVNTKTGRKDMKCHSCGGTGFAMKKDAGDVILLATPKDKDSATIAPDVAGYVTPPVDASGQQITELDRTWDLIYFSQWGTTTFKSDNETATGRFIDTQPVINRLHQYSDIFETVHKRFLTLMSEFYYPNTDLTITVTYGRRYMVETSDQIFEKYTNAKAKRADYTTLDLLLEQYYESEFRKNDELREYYLKLIKVEPLVHYDMAQVLSMMVPDSIKNEKVAYPDWKISKTVKEVNDTDVSVLKQDLTIFTENKTK